MSAPVLKKRAERCSFIRVCFLAEDLKCFGYKTDCPLYQRSNGAFDNKGSFNEAMDRLINKTRYKYARLLHAKDLI